VTGKERFPDETRMTQALQATDLAGQVKSMARFSVSHTIRARGRAILS
jgi:hypothetical protein